MNFDHLLLNAENLIKWAIKNTQLRSRLDKILTDYMQMNFTILNLIKSSFKNDHKVNYLIIYKQDDIIAFAQYKYTDTAKLSTIVVNPKYRKQGICTKMVGLLVKLIKKNHPELDIILDVLSKNKGAIKCYKNNNFEVIESFPNLSVRMKYMGKN